MEKEELIQFVQQAQNGDSKAMSLLYTEYKDTAYTIAMRETKSRPLSDDIVQETFIEVIQKIGDLQTPEAFPAWLKAIAYHQCTRYYKKKENVHESLVSENEDGVSIFDTQEEKNAYFIPDEALEQKEFKEAILTMINDLPDVQRSALYMFYFDELPLKVIAQTQGVSINTANTRLNRGRKAMKGSIEQYEKKHGIRLRSIAFFPFFKWLLSDTEEHMSAASVATVAQNVSMATGVAVSAPESVVGNKVVSATVSTNIGAQNALIPLITKIAAGIVALSIAISAPIAVSQLRNEQRETEASEWTSEIEAQSTQPSNPTEIDELTCCQVILAQYQAAMENHFYYDENGMSVDRTNEQLEYINSELQGASRAYKNYGGTIAENFKVYYALVDLNTDGVDELFIGATCSGYGVQIYDLFTLEHEAPVQVFDEILGYRTTLFVFADLSLQISSNGGVSGGENYYYVLPPGSCTPTPKNDKHDPEPYQFQWELIKTTTQESESRVNLVETFTPEQQRAVNIFLSNFAEQNFKKYPADDVSLLRFAFLHSKINLSGNVEYVANNQERISKNTVDTVLQRFFGHTIFHRTLEDKQYQFCYEYEDGYYYYQATDSEQHCNFAVVREMYLNEDGTYNVVFDIYHGEEYVADWGYTRLIQPSDEYYVLSPDDIKNYPELKLDGSGTAVIRDYIKSNSSSSYQMVSMG